MVELHVYERIGVDHLRPIERIAYGPGTPDELADDVPTWDDIFRARQVVGDDKGPAGAFPTPLHHRFWSAAKVAAAAGCPPHWVDMGMRFQRDDGDWEWTIDLDADGVEKWATACPLPDGQWLLICEEGMSDVPTEFDARCWVADRLGYGVVR